MMFRLRFALWRWIVLGVGLVVPLVALVLFSGIMRPNPLQFAAPQPREIAVRYQHATDALVRGNLEDAQKRLEALRADDPLNALIHAALGQAHRQAGRTAEAIASTRMALELDPVLCEAAYNLATDLVKQEQTEDALRALQQAVTCGFDVRTPATGDPDLAPLRDDPRLRIYLEGAATLPLTARSASLIYRPVMPHVGTPFTVTIELISLNEPAGVPQPPISVTWGGPATLPPLTPGEVTREVVSMPHGTHTAWRWTFHHRLTGREPFLGPLGPWEVQIGGVAVPIEVPILRIDGMGENQAAPALERPTRSAPPHSRALPAFRPGPFFNRPQAAD